MKLSFRNRTKMAVPLSVRILNRIIVILIFFIHISAQAHAQSVKLDTSFIGKWINTQYESESKGSGNRYLMALMTPNYFIIDSSGNCTLFIRIEQRFEAGKPVSIKRYGSNQMLTFKNHVDLIQVRNIKDYIAYSVKGATIIFRKVR